MSCDHGKPWSRHALPLLAGIVAATALLVPWPLSAESSLQTGARTASVGASAHLDFRIIIPPVLALSVEPSGALPGAAPRVSILSNTRHVLLTASAPESAGERPESLPRARGTMFLGARRGSVIAAESACRRDAPRVIARGASHSGAPIVDLQAVVCTVAMP